MRELSTILLRPGLVFLLLGMMLGSSFPAFAGQQMPIHRYSFNITAECGSNPPVVDSIGGAHGMVLGAGATSDGQQLLLPGGSSATQAYVDLPNGLISGLTSVTFEAWVTIDGISNWARVFDFGTGTMGEIIGPGGGAGATDYFAFMPIRSNDINMQRIDIWSQESANESFDSDFAQSLGVEYHYVVTFQGDVGGGGEVALYRDGVEEQGPQAASVTLSEIEDVNNWLGRSNWTGDLNLEGRFNEFRIYDVALTPDQVAASYEAGPDSNFGIKAEFDDGFEDQANIESSENYPKTPDRSRENS